MTFKRFACASLSAASLALLASHCSSAGSAGASGSADAGSPFEAGSGLCLGSQPSGAVPPLHRPAPAQCARTPPPINVSLEAAAPTSCNSDADCVSPGTTTPLCVQHQCGVDSCLADADCPSGEACVCDAFTRRGSYDIGNRCVPALCQFDSDCGPGGYCTGNRTYAVTGLQCTTPSDSCRDPKSDCACLGDASVYPYAECTYAPEVGQFVCQGLYFAG